MNLVREQPIFLVTAPTLNHSRQARKVATNATQDESAQTALHWWSQTEYRERARSE